MVVIGDTKDGTGRTGVRQHGGEGTVTIRPKWLITGKVLVYRFGSAPGGGAVTPEGTTAMTKLSYSVQEAAQVIGCSAGTVHALIDAEDLPYFTMSEKPRAKRYVRHVDLEAYINFRANRAA